MTRPVNQPTPPPRQPRRGGFSVTERPVSRSEATLTDREHLSPESERETETPYNAVTL